jgi:hypothetical protein
MAWEERNMRMPWQVHLQCLKNDTVYRSKQTIPRTKSWNFIEESVDQWGSHDLLRQGHTSFFVFLGRDLFSVTTLIMWSIFVHPLMFWVRLAATGWWRVEPWRTSPHDKMFLEASVNEMPSLLDADLTTLAGCVVSVRSLQYCHPLQDEGNWKSLFVVGKETVKCAWASPYWYDWTSCWQRERR